MATSCPPIGPTPRVEPLGGVVVIQEIFGVNDHIRSVADRFAAAGYVAVAPALFDRVERGRARRTTRPGPRPADDLAWNLPIDEALDGPRRGGRCTGRRAGRSGSRGSPRWASATAACSSAAIGSRRARHLGAAVAYYPSMAAQLLVEDQPHVPLLVHLGDLDARVTPADGELAPQPLARRRVPPLPGRPRLQLRPAPGLRLRLVRAWRGSERSGS